MNSNSGLKRKGKTFRWKGEYHNDMNEAQTLETELNSLLEFDPTMPEEYKSAEAAFIGNVDPELQLKVIEQLASPKIVFLDTMNFWIEGKKEALLDVIKKVNILVFNEGEARRVGEM